jgi:hypothetical protein
MPRSSFLPRECAPLSAAAHRTWPIVTRCERGVNGCSCAKGSRRNPRVAARWLLRYLEEDPHATIDEAALAASSLAALTGVAHQEAAQTLRAMAERATSRRRARGVA